MMLDLLPLAAEGDIPWPLITAFIAIFVAIVILYFLSQFVGLWIQAFMSNANVSMFDLIGMKFRKVDARGVVMNKIRAVKAGLDVTTNDLETHYLAGGRVQNVISSLIAADRARIGLGYKTACAIDLAGRDVLEAVHTSVNPKVIDCPGAESAKPSIDAVAKDGIQLKAKARVTGIGSAETYKAVLENPDGISQRVLEKGLDAGTAFEILSIDIADVDVGTNVGAQLQADQAEADKRRFQAEAEKRAAMARAREAEMSALVEENRAKVVEAEATVPLAIAEAFRSGNLGVMDYYKFRNIQADTGMRDSIGGKGPGPSAGTPKT